MTTIFGVDQVWYVTDPQDIEWHTVDTATDTTCTTKCGLLFEYPNAGSVFNGEAGLGEAPRCQECAA